MKKILLPFLLLSCIVSNAQQHFFYGFQADYGSFTRTFEQNKSILKGKNMGRMFNLGVSGSYRVFDQLTLEAGVRLNGMKWKLQDVNFKSRNAGFESLMITHNRFMSFYGNIKYSYDLGRKKYFFTRIGYEFSAIGSRQLHQEKRFELNNEFVEMDFTYGKSNHAFVPEIGYEFFNSAGNLISIGLKYHMVFAGNSLIKGNYHVTNQKDFEVFDQATISGSYVALTFQINGLLHYIPKKERVKKEKPVKPTDNPKVPPVLVDTTPAKPVDTTQKVVTTTKTAYDREYAVTNKIKVDSKTVKITVWDHQIEDGDRINLILNSDWILTDYTLENKRYTFEVTLHEGDNTLILYALNLGKYKPNTAAIMVDDGTKKQQVVLESTLDESSALEIKFESK